MNNLLKKRTAGRRAQAHGDERRSPLQEREEAKAMSEHDMLPSEPVTIRSCVADGLGTWR